MMADLRGASVAVPESFGVIITTQSDVPPAGAFRTELDYARGVRDGRIAEGSIRPVDSFIAAQMLNSTLNAAAELPIWAPGVTQKGAPAVFARPLLMGVFER